MSSHNGPLAFDRLIERYENLADGYSCFKLEILRAMRERSIEPNFWKAFAHSVYFEMKLAAEKDLEQEQLLLTAMVNGIKKEDGK